MEISKLFSFKQFLILSIAINIALISKMWSETEKQSFLLMADETKVSSEQKLISSISGTATSSTDEQDDEERVINLDHGDPTMYEKYWKALGEKTAILISGWQSLSYFSDIKNICWFLEPKLATQITKLHKLVGNAVAENKHIVVGTGSTQLYQAAIYALSPHDAVEPMNVVSAAPYYSCYPSMTDFLKSGLYKWAGDANSFDKEGSYIELVTSPNNPDGFTRMPVVNRSEGMVIHDFAYYWPQYTPISYRADHDIMLFTVSKSTGHAGTRIGWALVKDKVVAKKMTKFIELNTIGVSKDSQLRAAKILEAVSDSCENNTNGYSKQGETFFDFGYQKIAKRWTQLRKVVNQNGIFSLPDFSSAACNFFDFEFIPQPAFAWLKCEGDVDDCESFFKEHKIFTRSGKHFGVSTKYVRISMLDRGHNFNLFLSRLSKMM